MNLLEFLQMIVGGIGRAAQSATPLLLSGLKMTIWVSVCGILIGILIGLFACLLRLSRLAILRGLAGFYIWIIRGTPMIVQAMFIHFGVSQLIRVFVPGFSFSAVESSIIVTSLNAGAYLAEVFRGGINAVPKGQMEAARSLGLGYGRTMRKVILPQAVKIAIPSMVNQFIITIKDTSILSVIALPELTNKTNIYVGATYNQFGGWFYVGFFYLALISILMLVSRTVEARFNYDRKN